MKILYFAWLRTRAGISEEMVDAPASVATVADLIVHLRSRSPGHAEAFADLNAVRVAVNQDFADFDRPVGPGDEVAFFPPVTGG
jgi:sulfur-carrier protein